MLKWYYKNKIIWTLSAAIDQHDKKTALPVYFLEKDKVSNFSVFVLIHVKIK